MSLTSVTAAGRVERNVNFSAGGQDPGTRSRLGTRNTRSSGRDGDEGSRGRGGGAVDSSPPLPSERSLAVATLLVEVARGAHGFVDDRPRLTHRKKTALAAMAGEGGVQREEGRAKKHRERGVALPIYRLGLERNKTITLAKTGRTTV